MMPVNVIATDDMMVCGDLLSDESRQTMAQWFHQHGVDPADVSVPNVIIRNVEERQILCMIRERNEQGKCFLRDGHVATKEMVFQLEAAPMPFPKSVIEESRT